MVGDHHDLVAIEDGVHAQFLKLAQGDRGRDVVREDEVDGDLDQVPWSKVRRVRLGLSARDVFCQYLFG
jgi:hypothetical protein